jgi:protein-S-isoprenylcysteine O-methyltransferase Ste14
VRRAAAAAGSAAFFVVAPGIVVGLIPWALTDGWDANDTWAPLVVLGAVLLAAGLLVLVQAFVRFVVEGMGTPAPVAPTEHLVVGGLYRYVRNPMYVAVISLVFGQGLLFGNASILEYGLVVWLGFHIFVLAYEEPTLRDKFGDDYEAFCAHVRRWWPRVEPWRGTDNIAKQQEHRTDA